MSNKFKIAVPITKCYLRKTADGVEKYVIEGMASNTDLDLTGERMADSAIKSMASSLQSRPVVFKNEHGEEWDAEFGEVTALYATTDHQLLMEAELDPDHYRTKTLVKALEKGKQLGLSIGGLVPDGGAVKEWVSDLGRMIKTYKEIDLEEISVTGSPAVAATWLNTINKSVKDWKETTMDPKVTKTEEITEPEVAQPELEQPAEVIPAEDAIVPQETTVTEEVETKEAAPEEGATSPVADEAPEQKDEPAPEAEKSAPAQAKADTSEVKKAEYLGEYAEAAASYGVIDDLSDSLASQVFMTIADDEMDAATQIQTVDAMLSEFHAICLKVATALIESDAAGDAAEAGKSTKKKLTKALTDVTVQVAELNKSLAEKDEALATVQNSLDEASEKLETFKNRKAITFDKFPGSLGEVFDDPSVTKAAEVAAQAAAKAAAKDAANRKAIAENTRLVADLITGGR